MTDFLPDASAMAAEFVTPRDFLRCAVSLFRAHELVFGHGTTDALDEAAFIILEGLSLPIDRLEPFFDARLLPAERDRLARLIHDRVTTRKPASYLLNKAYVGGVPFYVDERVIVPRSFIGELLRTGLFSGEDASSLLDPQSVTSALDLCTGSGCLAILMAQTFPHAMIDAVDLSGDALEVAKINLAASGLSDRIGLVQGDLFAPLKGRRYDLIITNPPYVGAQVMSELPPEYAHEPEMALGSGEDGLDIVRRILADAGRHLNAGGGLLCEMGEDREILEAEFPDLPFLWLDTEQSSGEVFWLSAEALGG
ncbi:MAG: modification methylase,hemK family [Hyphomicrobiales bacterium]|nr:modification methylase,hemK family [Hyphomicrobiales bacterium]